MSEQPVGERPAPADRLPEPPPAEPAPVESPRAPPQPPGEVDGPRGPEPTRFGDWEQGGRCTDF